MKRIAIDLRSLQSRQISGVENFGLNLVENLLTTDKRNVYTLFFNARKNLDLENFRYINAEIIKTSIPNQLLNLGFKMNLLKVEKFIGNFDVLLMPNLNNINLAIDAKLAVCVHDLSFAQVPEFYDLKRRFWHRFIGVRKLLHRADLVVAVSNYTKLDLIKLFGINEQKIAVVYPGIDTRLFRQEQPVENLRACRNIYGLPGKYFLFLNTIEPRKNLQGLITAFEQANVEADLVVAGKRGWKTAPIFRALRRSKKSGRIHYLGYVDEVHKPALIKMATALIHPSFYEGFGFQVLEAMAMGVPVITSQVTSLPEVTLEAALFVNPYNIRDLVRAMQIMEKDEPFRQILIKRGLERAKVFSWKKTAEQILMRVGELAERKRPNLGLPVDGD